jgi:hypothetical protein
MSQATLPPQPLTVALPARELPKGEAEYQSFLRLLPEMLKTYRGKFVAIHNGQVVDCDGDDKAPSSGFRLPWATCRFTSDWLPSPSLWFGFPTITSGRAKGMHDLPARHSPKSRTPDARAKSPKPLLGSFLQ